MLLGYVDSLSIMHIFLKICFVYILSKQLSFKRNTKRLEGYLIEDHKSNHVLAVLVQLF